MGTEQVGSLINENVFICETHELNKVKQTEKQHMAKWDAKKRTSIRIQIHEAYAPMRFNQTRLDI